MLKYWLLLITRECVSNVQALSLLSRLGSAAAIYQADEDALKDADGRPVPASLLDKSLTGAEIILQQCYQKNIHVMTIQDAQYPARLRVISDPPIVLYYKGVFPAIDTSPVIALFNVGGEFYAINDRCSHGNASMSEGYLEDDATVECPLHAASFCLKTGKALCLPATDPLTTYPVHVEGGDIFIDLPEAQP